MKVFFLLCALTFALCPSNGWTRNDLSLDIICFVTTQKCSTHKKIIIMFASLLVNLLRLPHVTTETQLERTMFHGIVHKMYSSEGRNDTMGSGREVLFDSLRNEKTC